jgi:hypothetical protein
MRREQVRSEFTQAERRQVFKDTLHGRALAEEGMVGGRYGAISKTNVVGSRVEYPKLPVNNPWHHDPVPPEESLGVDISAAPVVGEFYEVQASLREANDDKGMNNSTELSLGSPTSGELRSGAGASSDAIELRSPLPKRKKRRRHA